MGVGRAALATQARSMVRRVATLSAVLGLTLAAVGCTEPPSRSAVSDTLNQVSFQAPPTPPLPGQDDSTGSQAAGTPPSRGGPEIYGLHPRLPVTSDRPTTTSADGTTLNFDHADIREVLKVILGDVLGKPYTVDSQVQGEVTLSSTGALGNDDLLGILESVLRSNNATLINLGNSFQVVPLQNAVGRPEVDPILGRAPRVRPGYGLTIVPLRNISANAAAQFVQPLVAAPEDIRVDIGRNLLLFAGTGVERQAVVDTLADLDVNWLANKAVGLFPLQVTTPEAVIAELNGIFGSLDTSGAEAPLVRFLPIARLNAVLAVGTDNAQIEEVRRWVARLDRGKTVGTQFYVYNLKHAAADDTAKVLNDIFADQGNGLSSASNAAAPAPLGASTLAPEGSPSVGETQSGAGPLGGNSGFSGGGGGGESGSQSLLPSPPAGSGAGGSSSSTSGGPPGGTKIVANRVNNSLLIRATPEVFEEIETTLRRLDTAPLQVLIEATIAEVTLNDSLRYGVQYYIQAHGLRFGYSSQGSPRGEFGIEPNSTVPGFNFIFTGGGSNISIDALAQITDVNVLSSPSVVVQDNSEATLTVGDEVPITTRQAISTDNTQRALRQQHRLPQHRRDLAGAAADQRRRHRHPRDRPGGEPGQPGGDGDRPDRPHAHDHPAQDHQPRRRPDRADRGPGRPDPKPAEPRPLAHPDHRRDPGHRAALRLHQRQQPALRAHRLHHAAGHPQHRRRARRQRGAALAAALLAAGLRYGSGTAKPAPRPQPPAAGAPRAAPPDPAGRTGAVRPGGARGPGPGRPAGLALRARQGAAGPGRNAATARDHDRPGRRRPARPSARRRTCAPDAAFGRGAGGRSGPLGTLTVVPPGDPLASGALSVLGACVGSFVGTLGRRVPEDWRGALAGRSACPACGATLGVRDLVPLLSWLALRGRCRHCARPIPPYYPLVELAALAIGLVSGLAGSVTAAPLGWTLLALALIDLRSGLLPDALTLPLAALGLTLHPTPDALIGAALGFLAFWAIAALYHRLRGAEGLGLGDAKLMAAAGAWLGWQGLPWVLLLGSLGTLIAARLAHRDLAATTAVALGPGLAAATWCVYLVTRPG